MSSAESLAPRTLLPPLRPTLDTHGPACRIAESRHTTDMAAFFTVCLCTANSGPTSRDFRIAFFLARQSLLAGHFLQFRQIGVRVAAEAGTQSACLTPLIETVAKLLPLAAICAAQIGAAGWTRVATAAIKRASPRSTTAGRHPAAAGWSPLAFHDKRAERPQNQYGPAGRDRQRVSFIDFAGIGKEAAIDAGR